LTSLRRWVTRWSLPPPHTRWLSRNVGLIEKTSSGQL
jgi:hypothetical protein